MAHRTELDYLIYNDPLGYADLILNGDPEKYLKKCVWEPWARGLEKYHLLFAADGRYEKLHELRLGDVLYSEAHRL